MVAIAILIALIVILQMISAFVKIGAISITLTLIPIVVGAAMYGPSAGAILGGAFGVIVLINCITGTDLGGNALWIANPAMTALLCMLKGIAAGFFAGLVYAAASKVNTYVGVFCAAIVSPVVNTGIFIAGMALFFSDTLAEWAGGSPIVYFALIGLTGLNFLVEFGVNIVLSPTVVRIIDAAKNAGKHS